MNHYASGQLITRYLSDAMAPPEQVERRGFYPRKVAAMDLQP